MLIDVSFKLRDPVMAAILGVIAENGPLIPKRISKGHYLCGHWSIDQMLPRGSIIEYAGAEDSTLTWEVPSYGVCDSPEQVCKKFNLEEMPGKYFISFVRLMKRDQPADGGWRWHKWGEYIGTQTPQCEYLHDEPEIQEVYTYGIHEVRPEFVSQIEEAKQSEADEVGAIHE
jgi:hypothetical protein